LGGQNPTVFNCRTVENWPLKG